MSLGDEHITRAARALHERDCSCGEWDDLHEATRNAYRDRARAALDAAVAVGDVIPPARSPEFGQWGTEVFPQAPIQAAAGDVHAPSALTGDVIPPSPERDLLVEECAAAQVCVGFMRLAFQRMNLAEGDADYPPFVRYKAAMDARCPIPEELSARGVLPDPPETPQ